MIIGIFMLFVIFVFCGLCSIGSFGQGMNPTIEEKATGSAVVAATLCKLKSTCIFRDDCYSMRRLAWVESHFGSDAGTFDRPNPNGI